MRWNPAHGRFVTARLQMILFALVAFVLAGWYGWEQAHSLAGLGEALWIVLVLSVLEVSLSFDNAVVNATVLKDMDPIW